MKILNNLEQPNNKTSSQGEETSQMFSGVEDSLEKFGSKEEDFKSGLPSASALKNFKEKKLEKGAQNLGESILESTDDVLDRKLNFEKLQPLNLTKKQNSTSSNSVEEEGEELNLKFKSVEELSKAYDNLQSDYTKKCQALAKLQKEKADNKENSLPPNSYGNLQEELEKFVLENQDAKNYEEEIAKLVLTNKQFANSFNPIAEAWKFIKQKNFISVEDVLKNNNFLNTYIQHNEDIKNKIINDYFSSINLQNTPNLITASGSETLVTVSQKPKSLGEASKLVEDMFS